MVLFIMPRGAKYCTVLMTSMLLTLENIFFLLSVLTCLNATPPHGFQLVGSYTPGKIPYVAVSVVAFVCWLAVIGTYAFLLSFACCCDVFRPTEFESHERKLRAAEGTSIKETLKWHCRFRWPLWVALLNLLPFLVFTVYGVLLVSPALATDASLVRIGYVQDTQARLDFRSPSGCDSPTIVTQPTLLTPPVLPACTAGTDFLTHVLLQGLTPDTTYQVTFVCGTATQIISFKTAPRLGNQTVFSFLLASGFLDRWPAYGDEITAPKSALELKPDFALFLGDFVYKDFPVNIGSTVDSFYAKYRHNYRATYFAQFVRSIPSLFIFSDHEIADSWEPGISADMGDRYVAATTAFKNYVGLANPLFNADATLHYYTIERGNVAFFVLDTRSFRSPRATPSSPAKTMLGGSQFLALQTWLTQTQFANVTFKFICSPSAWSNALVPDKKIGNWAEYLDERAAIFSYIRQNGIDGTIFLSGGLNGAYVTEMESGFYEISASPFSGFDATKLGSTGTTLLSDSADEIILFQQGNQVWGQPESMFAGFRVDTTVADPTVETTIYRYVDNTRTVQYSKTLRLSALTL